MPLGTTATKGLSFTNDWDKDITRLYQREEYAAQVRAEKERKTQFYANLLKQGHASNPRIEGELQTFYDGLNSKLAKIVTENPDLETNPTAMSEFLSVSEQYINNDYIRKDKQVAQEYEKLRNAVSQKQLTEEEWIAESKKYNDYINGTPGDGLEPYVFTNYSETNLEAMVKETAQLTGTMEKLGALDSRTGLYQKSIILNPEKLEFTVDAKYTDEKSKLAIDKRFSDYLSTNPGLSGTYNGPKAARNWFRDYVKNAAENETLQGPVDLLTHKNMSGSGTTPVTEAAYNEKLEAIRALSLLKDKDGNSIEGKMPADYSDSNYTFYGKSKAPLINASSNIRIPKQNGENITYVKFDLGKNVQINKTGVGNWITVAGIPHLEMHVEIENLGEPGKEQYSPQTLLEYGFVAQEQYASGIGPNMNERKLVGLKHTGIILVPLQVTPDGLSNWAKEHGGEDEQKMENEFVKNPLIVKDLNDLNKNTETQIDFFNKTHSRFIKTVDKSEALKVPWKDNAYVNAMKDGKRIVIDTTKQKDNWWYYDNIKTK